MTAADLPTIDTFTFRKQQLSKSYSPSTAGSQRDQSQIDRFPSHNCQLCFAPRQMNQIPTLAITLTGGLWFAAGVTEKMQTPMRFGLLIFAGLCDIGLVLAILRVRDVFHSYLEKVRAFHPPGFAEGRPKNPKMGRLGDYSMVTVYALLMLAASVLSVLGAFTFYWPFEAQMRPLGIVVTIGILTTLFAFLYSNWKRTALVAILSAVILALMALWIRRSAGGIR